MSGPFLSASPNTPQRFSSRSGPSSSFSSQPQQGSPMMAPIKPPKPPDRPLVPYMRFSKKIWHKVRDENPELQLWDIGKKVGEIWRDLSAGEKRVYQDEFQSEKVEYDKAMKIYQNSAAYQAYVAQKNLYDQQVKQRERAAAAAANFSAQPAQLQPTAMPGQQRHQQHHHMQPHGGMSIERGVFIQPVEEDDGEGLFSGRKLAGVRYERNHRMVAELFGDLAVPDTRNIIVQTRIDALRKQSMSLAVHQEKLENELKTLEEKFQNKKRSIEEGSQKFGQLLKRVCQQQPVVDEQKYEEMVKKATERLLSGYELYKKRQNEIAAARAEEARRAATAIGETPMPVAAAFASVPSADQSAPEEQSTELPTTEEKLPNGHADSAADEEDLKKDEDEEAAGSEQEIDEEEDDDDEDD